MNDELTVVQARQLKEWLDTLWVLLDQDDFNNISNIFLNAIEREIRNVEEVRESK